MRAACLVYPSAYRYWFNERLIKTYPYRSGEHPEYIDFPHKDEWGQMAQECQRLGFSFPLHVLVTSRSSSRHPDEMRIIHQLKPPLGEDAFGRIDRGIYIESPEMLFVDAASYLTIAQLAQLGCGLCGNYSFDADEIGGVAYREPVTDLGRLSKFVRNNSRLKNAAKAARVLNLGCVLSGARSPKEATLMLILCLPPRYGGYGLPWPVMNKRIDIRDRDRNVIEQNHFAGDLVWERRGRNLVIEYDSKAAHEDKYDRDKRRMGQLGYMGYEVISVTPRMLYSFDEMENVALRAARILGIYIRKEHRGATKARIGLRDELLKGRSGPSATETNERVCQDVDLSEQTQGVSAEIPTCQVESHA